MVGKNIRLREYRIEDLEVSYRLLSDLKVFRTLRRDTVFPLTIDSQRAFIESCIKNTSEKYHFAIEAIETKEYIGGCGINALDRKNSTATIGLWIGKEYGGMGFGSDTLRTLCKFIFDELNIRKIKLEYFDFNEHAGKVYSAVGFKVEGVLRGEMYREGKYHDVIQMGMFRHELRERNK